MATPLRPLTCLAWPSSKALCPNNTQEETVGCVSSVGTYENRSICSATTGQQEHTLPAWLTYPFGCVSTVISTLLLIACCVPFMHSLNTEQFTQDRLLASNGAGSQTLRSPVDHEAMAT